MKTFTSSDYCRMLLEKKEAMQNASQREKTEIILTFAMPLPYRPEKDITEIEDGVRHVFLTVQKAEKTKNICERLKNLSREEKEEALDFLFELSHSGLFPKLDSVCIKTRIIISQADDAEITECCKQLADVFSREYNSAVWRTDECSCDELTYRAAALVNLKNHENVLLPEKIIEMSACDITVLTAHAVANGIWEKTVNRESKRSSLFSLAGKSLFKCLCFLGVAIASGFTDSPIDSTDEELIKETILIAAGTTTGSTGFFYCASEAWDYYKSASKEKAAEEKMKELYYGKTREELKKAAEEETEEELCDDIYDNLLYTESHLW